MSEEDNLDRKLAKVAWSPERKVMGSAVAVVLLGLVQMFSDMTVPLGFEGGVAVIVAYFLPNKRTDT